MMLKQDDTHRGRPQLRPGLRHLDTKRRMHDKHAALSSGTGGNLSQESMLA